MHTKIVFEPGAFDDFDGTQSELDEIITKITEFLNSPEFLEEIEDADFIEDNEAEEIREVFNKNPRTLN